MRSFLTFLSLFTLLFFLAPILCLGMTPAQSAPAREILLPEYVSFHGTDTAAADLILGAVAALDVRGYQDEALRAAAVTATTNLAKLYGETGCADGLTVLTADETKKTWGDYWFSQYWPQLQRAVRDTWGELLTKDGEIYAQAHTFPLSWGQTEIGVACPYDETSNRYETAVTVPLDEFTAVFPGDPSSVTVKKAQSGRVETVTSGKTVLTGYETAKRFNLPSPAFTVTATASSAVFLCRGQGDGIGMSLYGANEMAKRGAGYREILSAFYPDAVLQEANRSLGSR